MDIHSAKSLVLISSGLFGIGGHEVILRLFHSRFMGNDIAHGLWFGICLGLEIVGLVLLLRSKIVGRLKRSNL